MHTFIPFCYPLLTQGAFRTVETPEEQIRAVEIAVTMLVAQASTGVRNLKMVHKDLCSEVFKMLAMPRVLSDARHQLSTTTASRSIDENGRGERIRAVLYIIMRAESFCLMHDLSPILPAEGEVSVSFLLVRSLAWEEEEEEEEREKEEDKEEEGGEERAARGLAFSGLFHVDLFSI